MNYKHSLIGFHNPDKHYGLTPEIFLDAYIVSLEKRSKKKDGYKRAKLISWIKKNRDSQLKFVARLFPSTLDVVE